jgi:alcohol dehydrogenase class IV
MAANVRALRQRQPEAAALRRYDEIGCLVTGASKATAEDGINWVRTLVTGLDIPPLSRYGLKPEHGAELVKKAGAASSMKANPIVLTPEELAEVLERAM